VADRLLAAVDVRPIGPGERRRFDENLDEYHWLGHHLVGETMRYVAVGPDGAWVALVGFGAAALSCKPRDSYIGWNEDQHFRRLRYVTNNQRFCVLPAGRRPNLASNVLAKTLRRLCGDFQSRWGHPVLMVETFVDPARHAGTCYTAGGFVALGETLGYGRSNGRYHHHGKVKFAFGRLLRRDARLILTASFDHPVLMGGNRSVIDLNALDFDSDSGLLGALEAIIDPRKKRGVRHEFASILALATAATLAGARSIRAIGEHAADCPQEVLGRLGAKYHPIKRCYIAPHAETFRRALGAVDAAELDGVVGAWLFDQVRLGRLEEETLVLALDGKSLKGSLREDGKAVHLFSAMVHGSGIVVAQTEVDEKSNEITAFRPLLEALDLTGALVTADAMHTQREHARFVVEEKHADYLFQVKENQPTLLGAIKAIPDSAFSPEHEETSKGHGRIEHRYVRVAPAKDIDFPHAAQVVVVYRERADLADVMSSAETSYYITSIKPNKAGTVRLGRYIREHWGIENKIHWVRDWSFDEDRHQLRASSSAARAMATLRNLAISLLRLAGATNISAALRWVARDQHRAAALIGA
jgi:predicted transposase YbfD/YdcC